MTYNLSFYTFQLFKTKILYAVVPRIVHLIQSHSPLFDNLKKNIVGGE